MSDSDEEFDDDLALEDINWDDFPALSAPQPRSRTSSYTSGDLSQLNESFFIELDTQVEPTRPRIPSDLHLPLTHRFASLSGPPSSGISSYSANATGQINKSALYKYHSSSCLSLDVLVPRSYPLTQKRLRSPTANVAHKKIKIEPQQPLDTLDIMLEDLQEELNCPICCDLIVATHLINPCGHTFCGECCWDWIEKRKALKEKQTCAVCRTEHISVIPNITLQSAVDKSVDIMILRGKFDAHRRSERAGRQRAWQQSVFLREKHKAGAMLLNEPTSYMEVRDDGEIHEVASNRGAR